MRVLTWNVHGNQGLGARLERVLDAVAEDGADLVALQEVSARGPTWDRLRAGLADRGYPGARFSGDPTAIAKTYGNVVASRHPLRPAAQPWAAGQPWPQLVAAAVVDVPGLGDVELVTVHVPNGAGNGWRKIDALEALAAAVVAAVTAAPDTPRILTGDFNEPHHFDAGGAPVRFGQTVRAQPPTREGTLRRRGETHRRTRWDDAVRHMLTGPHLRLAHPRPEPTHRVRGRDRCFDHVLVSPALRVVDTGYHHAWRADRLSDHSAAWADVEPRAARAAAPSGREDGLRVKTAQRDEPILVAQARARQGDVSTRT